MDSIINLVRSMQTGEIKLLRHFHRLQDKTDKKKNLLFENAVKWKNCKNPENFKEKIIRELYGKNSRSEQSFEKLKARLRADILNILLLQESSVKCKSKHEMAVFDCRRLMMQGDILLGRGMYHDGITILERASVLAQKNELYSEQLMIDGVCSTYNITHAEANNYHEYSQKIKKATTLMEKTLFAKNLHDDLIAFNMFNSNTEKPVEEWQHKLDIIGEHYISTGSAKIGFYFNLASLHFYRHTGQYERSLGFAMALLKQEEMSYMFQTAYYAGNIHLETAKSFLLVKKYDDAIYHAGLSASYFGSDQKNVLASQEVLYYCYLTPGNYKSARTVTEQTMENPYLQQDTFLLSKWWFLRAGVEFKMQEYQKAIASLKKCNELFRDKAGWMLSCVLFEAMCRIESGNLEWFEYRLEGLKKLMLRHTKELTGNQNKRFMLIFQVLKTLNKNGYDFIQTLQDEHKNIKLLTDGEHCYKWNPTGCEVVRFDEWLCSKAAVVPKNKKAAL